jgi:glucose/arabinose dehydrogenase
MLLIILILITLSFIIFYIKIKSTCPIINSSPSINSTLPKEKIPKQPIPKIIENDVATTRLVRSKGLGKNAQHIALYNDLIYIRFLHRNKKGNTIIVLNKYFKVIDEFCKVPGTCIQVVDNYLYVGVPHNIYRYDIDESTGLVNNKDSPSLILRGVHSNRVSDSPIFVIDKGIMYVHIPSQTNSCQIIHLDRKRDAPGEMPCNRFKFTSNVWLFEANKVNQTLDMGQLYATGIRKMKSLVIYNNQLYGIIQGRDSLFELYPQFYTKEQGDKLASDELVFIQHNSSFGFPYCYWDSTISKRVLAPEYKGDGKELAGCNSLTDKPIKTFDNHNGPNDLLIDGNVLYIAWNGKPYPLKCTADTCSNLSVTYYVLNKNDEEMEIMDSGILVEFDKRHLTRPSGLAKLPDGSILIVDSMNGKLWKSVLKK